MNTRVSYSFQRFPYGARYGACPARSRRNKPYIPTSVGSKELDEETGLYYYGARYYDPKVSLWLSVDPLAGEYPGMSPYNYTAGNPVVLVDPDGRSYSPTKWLKNLIIKWNTLNNKEKNIIRWEIQFYKALSIEKNAEEAYKMTAKIFGKNGKGDISDAFRHAYWQARNVQEVGKRFTQKWADAHEYSTPKDEVFTDLVMDIHNNDVGIEIGLKKPNASPEELAKIILNRIEKGDMLILDKNNKLLRSDGTQVEKNEIRRYQVSSAIANEIINNPESQKTQNYEYD